MRTKLIELNAIKKVFTTQKGIEIVAVDKVNLQLRKSEIISIVGPSGAGKSTLLHILAGLEKPSCGEVRIMNSQDNLQIGMVFQQNTLFPWLTIEKNLIYSLELQKIDRKICSLRAVEVCSLIGLDPLVYLSKYPHELSGGELRRVAIGMSIARPPQVLLLDEPTSQLDYFTKWRIQDTLQHVWLTGQISIIIVTHDLEEAIYLSDRIFVMEHGKTSKAIDIDIPRPRRNSIRTSTHFQLIREQVIEAHNHG